MVGWQGAVAAVLRAGEEGGERVGDAVYLGEFFVGDDDVGGAVGVAVSRRSLGGGWSWSGGGWGGAEEAVEAVRDAFYLLDLAVLDGAELDHLAVRGGEEGVWVRVQRAHAGLQRPVEEGC